LFGHDDSCVRFALAEQLAVQPTEIANIVSEQNPNVLLGPG